MTMIATSPLLRLSGAPEDGRDISSPRATDLLARIAERGDVIAQAPDGRVFVLLELDGAAFAALCAASAEREDLEANKDDDSQAEPSLVELHPLDRPTLRRKRKPP